MDVKLGILLVILGLFVAIITAVHRANRPAPRRVQERPLGPSLDDQISGLARAELVLFPGVTRDDLIDFGPEETYRGDPWRLLLMTYAIRVDRPPHPPYCPRACRVCFDSLDSLDDFETAIKDLARVAEVPCEVERGDGLRLRIGGSVRALSPVLSERKMDFDTFQVVLDMLQEAMPEGRRLYGLDFHPQIAFYNLDDAGFELIEERFPGLLTEDPLP
ncbi:hypothetical protein [Antarctobacter jejuensis]|uniref:hypothetical protein n=1 Tax=Antarctobacter jejuensis TaxID=1439938 RepID=UPI003FCF77B4